MKKTRKKSLLRQSKEIALHYRKNQFKKGRSREEKDVDVVLFDNRKESQLRKFWHV